MSVALSKIENEGKIRFYRVMLSISCLYLLPVFLKCYTKLLSTLPPFPFTVHAEPPAPKFTLSQLSFSFIPFILYQSLLSPLFIIISSIRPSIRNALGFYVYQMSCPPDWTEIVCFKLIIFVELLENINSKTQQHFTSYLSIDMASYPSTVSY